MTLIYFTQGFFFGLYITFISVVDTIFLYAEIAADKEIFLNEDNISDVIDEINKAYDE